MRVRNIHILENCEGDRHKDVLGRLSKWRRAIIRRPAPRRCRGEKIVDEDGIIDITIWRPPMPLPPSRHPFKYRLLYGTPKGRIVLHDNERGKGDHKHIRDREFHYEFISVERLLIDFMEDVKRQKELAPWEK